MVDDVVSRGERKIVMELEKLREKPSVCNGLLLLVIDISSIQGIIVGALLYTMHSFYGTFNHLTSGLLSSFSTVRSCRFSFSREILQYRSMLLDIQQTTVLPSPIREDR